MEIIKHGDIKQKFEAKCYNCGCEFVADRTETYDQPSGKPTTLVVG